MRQTLRYWLCSNDLDRVRVEWTTAAGTPATSEGVLRDGRVHWIYDSPPDDLAELARDCVLDQNEFGVDGAELLGYETAAEMDRAMSRSEAA